MIRRAVLVVVLHLSAKMLGTSLAAQAPTVAPKRPTLSRPSTPGATAPSAPDAATFNQIVSVGYEFLKEGKIPQALAAATVRRAQTLRA